MFDTMVDLPQDLHNLEFLKSMETEKIISAIKDLPSAESSGTGLNSLSPSKDNYAGVAAFSLASLDQGPRSGTGSMINLQFDPAVFFKSSSFDSLHTLLGSQIFKNESTSNVSMNSDKQSQVIPPLSMSNINSSFLNNSATSLTGLLPLNASPSSVKSLIPASIPSNVISTSAVPPMSPIHSNHVNMNMSQSMAVTSIQSHVSAIHSIPSYTNALIQPKEQDRRLIEKKDENSKFVDVTPFLTLPQHEAAKKLGIPSSTLAKRWKEASCNRKWPYRTVSKLDKEILTLLKNVESAKAELSPSVEANLGLLLKKRNEELKTVLVRL